MCNPVPDLYPKFPFPTIWERNQPTTIPTPTTRNWRPSTTTGGSGGSISWIPPQESIQGSSSYFIHHLPLHPRQQGRSQSWGMKDTFWPITALHFFLTKWSCSVTKSKTKSSIVNWTKLSSAHPFECYFDETKNDWIRKIQIGRQKTENEIIMGDFVMKRWRKQSETAKGKTH